MKWFFSYLCEILILLVQKLIQDEHVWISKIQFQLMVMDQDHQVMVGQNLFLILHVFDVTIQ
jgi:hypothetical protein